MNEQKNEKLSWTEKMEAKTEAMKQRKAERPKATKKQKIAAAIIIPVSAILVVTAIASPNNNNRETKPDVPADTSHHASSQIKSNVKFNGKSPDVEQAISQIREIAVNPELSQSNKIDKVEQLAKTVDVSTKILNDYTNGLVLSVRNKTILEDDTDVADLITLFKASVVAVKNNHSGFNGEFADDYVQIVKALYRNTDSVDSQFITENMNQLNSNINNVEY